MARVVDLVVLTVISSFQDVKGCKLQKMAGDLEQAQKGDSYKYDRERGPSSRNIALKRAKPKMKFLSQTTKE